MVYVHYHGRGEGACSVPWEIYLEYRRDVQYSGGIMKNVPWGIFTSVGRYDTYEGYHQYYVGYSLPPHFHDNPPHHGIEHWAPPPNDVSPRKRRSP